MARLLGATLRLLVLALAGLTVVAVFVNRLVPLETSRAIPFENLPISVNQFACGSPDADATFLVPSSGRLLEFKLNEADRLDHATFVSWRGQEGERLVFGRWRHPGDWGNPVSQVGIACVSYPSGKLLASRETPTLPIGSACNLPGLNGRLLFTTSDGCLHTSEIRKAVAPWRSASRSQSVGSFSHLRPARYWSWTPRGLARSPPRRESCLFPFTTRARESLAIACRSTRPPSGGWSSTRSGRRLWPPAGSLPKIPRQENRALPRRCR